MNQHELIENAKHFMNELFRMMEGKGKEYTRKDAFENFDQAALRRKTIPEDALAGMQVKHQVSIDTLIDDLKLGKKAEMKVWKEKLGDDIIYRLILYCMIVRRDRI